MNCKIKSITIETNLDNISLYEHLNSLEELEAQIKDLDNPQNVTTSYSQGTITTKNGYTYVKYTDDEILDTDNTTTEISFKNDTPDEIFVLRKGAIESNFVFIKGKPCQSVIHTIFMDFDYIATATEIRNKLLSENYLEIFYYIQISGAVLEKRFLRIEVEK